MNMNKKKIVKFYNFEQIDNKNGTKQKKLL
jgi:hypothetical protein